MKRHLRMLLVASAVLVTAPLMANAPVTQYQVFDRDATEIKDNFTKLAWQRDRIGLENRTKRTYATADSRCPAVFGGRLPTVKELLTIVDEDPHREYEFGQNVDKAIDGIGGRAFASSTYVDAPYWSSTPTGTTEEVWGVSFADGTMVRLKKTDQAYARCVK